MRWFSVLRHVSIKVAVVAFGLAALVFTGLAATGDGAAAAYYQGKAPVSAAH